MMSTRLPTSLRKMKNNQLSLAPGRSKKMPAPSMYNSTPVSQRMMKASAEMTLMGVASAVTSNGTPSRSSCRVTG